MFEEASVSQRSSMGLEGKLFTWEKDEFICDVENVQFNDEYCSFQQLRVGVSLNNKGPFSLRVGNGPGSKAWRITVTDVKDLRYVSARLSGPPKTLPG